MGESKRAQEMRIEEFSRHELRESHATKQELTSQIKELQERMIFLNGKRFWQSTSSSFFKEFLTLSIRVLQVETPSRRVQGDLLRKVKNKLEAQFQCRVLQENHQPGFFFFPAEVPQNSLANQQRLQISELQFDKFPILSTFSRWKTRFNPVFPRRLCYGSKKWRWSIRWMIKNHRA